GDQRNGKRRGRIRWIDRDDSSRLDDERTKGEHGNLGCLVCASVAGRAGGEFLPTDPLPGPRRVQSDDEAIAHDPPIRRIDAAASAQRGYEACVTAREPPDTVRWREGDSSTTVLLRLWTCAVDVVRRVATSPKEHRIECYEPHIR